MDCKVRFTKAAVADFEELLTYSWASFPDQSERFGNAILDQVELLERFPFIGSPVPDEAGVRQLIHTPVVIEYRVDESRGLVEILHFRHAARIRRH